MSKLLYTTILAGLLSTSFVSAEPLHATIGGLLDFQLAKRTQDAPYGDNISQISPNNKEVRFHNNASIVIKAEGKSDVGILYGGIVKIDPSIANRNLKDTLLQSLEQKNKSYIYMGSEFGMLQLGSNDSAGYLLKVGAEDLALGTGGTGYWNYLNTTMPRTGEVTPLPTPLVYTPSTITVNGTVIAEQKTFIQMPMLMSDYLEMLSGKSESARKITLITPHIKGLRAGVSYTPDSLNHGDGDRMYDATNPRDAVLMGGKLHNKQHRNAISGGIYYDYDLDNIKVTASWVADYAPAKIDNAAIAYDRNKLNSWNLGGKISYAGFNAGGSYGRWNKSLSPTTGAAATANPYVNIRDDSDYWTAGAGYSQGPAGISLTYFKSTFEKNEYKTWSVAAEYKLAPGLMPYAEITHIKQTPFKWATPAGTPAAVVEDSTRENSGTVFMLGAKVQF